MMWNISTGFSIEPYSGSSDIIKSMSTFAWMKSPSVDLRTVPLIPIRQCSFVLCSTALVSRFLLWPGLFMFVRIQQMSSHLLKPHLRRQNLPMSKPSLLPHHKNTKLRLAATSPISNSIIWKIVSFEKILLDTGVNDDDAPDPSSRAARWWLRKSSDILRGVVRWE